MMDQLELKYITLVGMYLRNFTQKSPTLFNFSCPICGDSKMKKNRARGYIYEKQGKLLFHCHNCTTTMSIPRFIKQVAPGLYDQFRLEQVKQDKKMDVSVLERTTFEKPKFLNFQAFKALSKVSQLPESHPIKKFVVSRKIPTDYHWKLFASDRFMHWVNEYVIPEKFSKKVLEFDCPRLVIPFFDKDKRCFAFQGRAIRTDVAKYITISLNKNERILYGRDTVDISRPIYVMEGPIDSMFIPNSVAVGSCYLNLAAALLPKDQLILVFDNEPRNKEVIQVMGKAIEQGFRITIFPDSFKHKDINDAIVAGMESSDIQKVLNDYNYKGLAALLALKNWERI
jgi:hypothetical protein